MQEFERWIILFGVNRCFLAAEAILGLLERLLSFPPEYEAGVAPDAAKDLDRFCPCRLRADEDPPEDKEDMLDPKSCNFSFDRSWVLPLSHRLFLLSQRLLLRFPHGLLK